MSDITENQPFGSSPWPTKIGNQTNTRAAKTAIRVGGEILWSMPISGKGLASITIAEDGCVIVASVDRVMAIEPSGAVRWQRETESWFGEAVALADRSIALTTANRFICLDQDNGEERWFVGIEGCGEQSPSIAPGGNIICKFALRDGSDLGLRCFTSDGEILWSYSLAETGWTKPLILDDGLVVVDGSYLAGLDYEGRLLWLANRHGFVASDEARRLERRIAKERFSTHPMQLDGNQVVAGCKWWEDQKLLIFDIATKLVAQWPGSSSEKIPFTSPITITKTPDKVLAGTWLGDIRSYDISGQLLFEKKLHWDITNIISDIKGNIVASTSVSADYWEKYKEPYRLQEDGACSLRGFDAMGNQLFQWNAPGPLAEALAVGKAGEIYCVSKSRLWAIG